MSDDRNLLVRRRQGDAEVFEYASEGPSGPTLPAALAQLARAFNEIGGTLDAIFEYERNRMGEIKCRIRCYRSK
jgi:hypothetical protein